MTSDQIMEYIRSQTRGLSGASLERAEQRVYDQLSSELPVDSDQLWDAISGLGYFKGPKNTFVPIIPQGFKSIVADNGWLSPQGTFFPCNFHEHSEAARKLKYHPDLKPNKRRSYVDERELEWLGWVKCQFSNPKLGYHFYNLEDNFKPTKAQINAVVDRCLELGVHPVVDSGLM